MTQVLEQAKAAGSEVTPTGSGATSGRRPIGTGRRKDVRRFMSTNTS